MSRYLGSAAASSSTTLMNLGTISAKCTPQARASQNLVSRRDLACTVVKVDVDSEDQDLFLFRTRPTTTHRSDPLPGAATCDSGTIRDPLSRALYINQAMRVMA